MFGSTILDVLIGTIVVFLAVSLVTSAITEGISSALALRQQTLRAGIQKMLNDPGFTGLARDLYNHALVSPFGDGTAKTGADLVNPPAYMNAEHFGTALLDLLKRGTPPGAPLAQTVAAVDDPQLRQTLQALLDRAEAAKTTLEQEIGDWFDQSMNRVSGWYKRRSQWISLTIAVALAALLNADAIHVIGSLWEHPALAAALEHNQVVVATTLPAGPAGARAYLDALEANDSLIGWSGWKDDPRASSIALIALMVVGWLLTASATLFGASFWFDLLQRLVQVRGTGKAEGDRPTGR